jgi:hypothetical protein
VAPVRLCNSYLASDQKMLGTGMAVLVGVLAIRWGAGLLLGGANLSLTAVKPDHTLDAANHDFNSARAK